MLQHDLAAHALLAGQEAAKRIADIGDIDIGDAHAGIVERIPYRRIGECLERLLQKTARGMGTDADNRDLAHQRRPPFVRCAGTYL